MEKINTKTQKKIKDKADRATQDAVLDNRTLTVLHKLVKRDMLSDLQGCLSTGKEANVYTAYASSLLSCKLIDSDIDAMHPCAIKIYQTSIMGFKDRLKYIQSEKRFTTFCNTNPRKLIKLWAEKEVRNLKRLNKFGIPAPKPIYVKNNILIMTLIEVDMKKEESELSFINRGIGAISMIQADERISSLYTKVNNTDTTSANSCKDSRQKISIEQVNIDNGANTAKQNNINTEQAVQKNETKNNCICDDIAQKSDGDKRMMQPSFNPAPRLKDYICDDYEPFYKQSLDLIAEMYKKCGLIHADFSEYNLLVSNETIYVIDVGQSVEKNHDNADEFLIKDIYNINMFFKRKGCNVKTVNEIYENTTGKHIPFCLKGIELSAGVTIPDNIHDVTDVKDIEFFMKQQKAAKISNNEPEKDDEGEGIRDEDERGEDEKDDVGGEDEKDDVGGDEVKRKEQKKIVKEAQREKRKTKIPKKEKRRKEKLNKKRK